MDQLEYQYSVDTWPNLCNTLFYLFNYLIEFRVFLNNLIYGDVCYFVLCIGVLVEYYIIIYMLFGVEIYVLFGVEIYICYLV